MKVGAFLLIASLSACIRGAHVFTTAPRQLEIPSAASALKVGERRNLEAVLVGSGSRKRVAPHWWIDVTNALHLVGDGATVLGIAPGRGTLHASFGRFLAVSDVEVVSDYAGTWAGSYIVDECTRVRGDGSSYCRFIVGHAIPFEVMLRQEGAALTGTGRFFSTGGRLLLIGTFTGTSITTGDLELSGILKSVDPSDQPETTVVTEWHSRLSSGSSMAGTFLKRRQFTNAFGPQEGVERCRLVDGHRLDDSSGSQILHR